MMKYLFGVWLAVFAGLSIIACVPSSAVRPPQLPLEKIIWTPQSDFGRTIKDKHASEFSAMVARITTEAPGLLFLEGGISITFRQDEQQRRYRLQLSFLDEVIYNTLQTNFPKRAASSLSRFLFPVARILHDQKGVIAEAEIDWVDLQMFWRTTDFVRDRYKSSTQLEPVMVQIKKQDLLDFSAGIITIQEIGRRSAFFSSIGKIEIDFNNTISD